MDKILKSDHPNETSCAVTFPVLGTAFESVEEILMRGHSNENHCAVLSSGSNALQGRSYFELNILLNAI